MGRMTSWPSSLLWFAAILLTLHKLKRNTDNFGDVYCQFDQNKADGLVFKSFCQMLLMTFGCSSYGLGY